MIAVTEPLPDAYLAEVQARVMATTRGDWPIEHGDGGTVAVGPFSFIEGWDGGAPHPADIEFTSKARRDVPALLGEVARLREQLAAADGAAVLNAAADALERQSCECGCRRGAPFLRTLADGKASLAGPTAAHPDACARCRTPFDPKDLSFDGRARQASTAFCRRCVDRCHEAEDAFHRCPVCDHVGGLT